MSYRYSLLALLLLLAAPALRAQTFVDVIDPAGTPALWGLEWIDGALFAANTSTDQIVQIDLLNGAVTPVVSLSFDPRGIAWDGTNWRVSTGFDSSDPQINTVSPSGAIVGSIPAPGALTHGLELRGPYLFAAQAYPDPDAAIRGLDPATGAVQVTIPFPATQPGGVAFVSNSRLWATNVGDDSGSSGNYLLYEINAQTGTVLQTVSLPDGNSRPRGLAYDGSRYLYVVARRDATPFDYRIFVLDLGASGNAQVAVSDARLDFGAHIFGTSADLPLVVSNVGDGDLQITGVQITGLDASDFSTTLTDGTVAPGNQVHATVSFNPAQSDDFARAATLTFQTNDVNAPTVSVALGGYGVYASPHVHFVEGSHDYGPVRVDVPPTAIRGDGRSAVRWPLRVVNASAAPLTVHDVQTSDPSFNVLTGGFPYTLATLDTLEVEVEFRPLEVRPFNEQAVVLSDDPARSRAIVRLAGEGILPDLDGGDPLWSLVTPDNPNTSFDDLKLFSIVVPGDLTGDGKPDLVFAARNYLVFAVDGNGWGTPSVLWQYNSCPDNFNCGAVSGNAQLYEYGMEAIDDLDGDGVRDVVIGTEGGHDRVVALSGATGAVIWEVGDAFGSDPYLAAYYSVSARLDANGDGTPDVATGTGSADLANSPNPYNHRRVYLLDGTDGDVIWEQAPGLPSFRTLAYTGGGEARVAAGGGETGSNFLAAYRASDGLQRWSINPGFAPFLIEPLPTAGGEDLLVAGTGSGLVRRSGADGGFVWSSGLGTVWDVSVFDDGTAVPKIAAGTTGPVVYAVRSDDGNIAWTYDLNDQVFDVATVPDVDGDGAEDVAATGKGGRTVLLSGATGALIWSFTFGDGSFDQSGEVVVAVPDMDWNGLPEVAFGTRDGRGFLLFGGDNAAAEFAAAGLGATPEAFTLLPAYPNPFGASATLRYQLPEAATVRLAVYDLLGRAVWTHEVEGQEAGAHAVAFDARDLASGVYVVRFEAGGTVQTQRMTRVR